MPRQCKVESASISGVEAVPVTVEVSVGAGIPGISIVGMTDTAIQEAKERVRAAIRASGFKMPNDKIVVNLAPGGLKKTGAGFDLPIALGILVATGQVGSKALDGRLFSGELSLNGKITPVSGDLAFCICASRLGLDYVSGKRERAPIRGISQLIVRNLGELHSNDALLEEARSSSCARSREAGSDFSEIGGHENAKRAVAIASAGRHGLLMIGPPGSGKTMLASRIPTILPSLTQEEALESAAVHSVAGEHVESILGGLPPFRSPHHTSTLAGLLGGGTPVMPGEVSLAHNGVLFLDELAEFRPNVLQGLRQPVEEGVISITRASAKVRMPARFMLVAATNPCPCGFYGDSEKKCKCAPGQVQRYLSRMGGPLIDRFEMQVDVHRLKSSEVLEAGGGESSSSIKDSVMAAREFGTWREARFGTGGVPTEKEDSGSIVDRLDITDDAKKLACSMADARKLGGRAIVGCLRVSRTIADMDQKEKIGPEHVAEAFAFRLSEIIGGE